MVLASQSCPVQPCPSAGPAGAGPGSHLGISGTPLLLHGLVLPQDTPEAGLDGTAALTPGRFPKEQGRAFCCLRCQRHSGDTQGDTGRAGLAGVTPAPCQLQQSHLHPLNVCIKCTSICLTVCFKQDLCHRFTVLIDLTFNLS